MMILGLAMALVVGLTMGLLGAGGSILTVPIFVYVLGFPVKEAIAMSLAVVGATSIVGALRHARMKNVQLQIVFIFGPVAMLGTYVGARLAVFFSGAAQLALFAIVMVAAAIFMLRDQPGDQPKAASAGWHSKLAVTLLVVEALAVGVLTGLVGVGGGFLIVPVLVFAGLPMKQAVGTSLLIIALKSFSGLGGYLGHVDVAWDVMTAFTTIAIVGIWVGAHLVQLVSPPALKRGFGVLILVMGVVILYQSLFTAVG
jgi:hypothetical protein